MMRGAIRALRRGGKAVNVGAVTENLPLNALWMMTKQISIQGSVWFTTAEGEEIVALPVLLDLSVFSTLSAVNDTLAEMGGNRQGRFANDVIESSRSPEGDTALTLASEARAGRTGRGAGPVPH
jgi:alcohol dehydrogenase